MYAILKKTVGPNFRAGDIVKGDNARITRLVDQKLAIRDNSLGTKIATLFSTMISISIFSFMIFMLTGTISKMIGFDFFNTPTGLLGFEMPLTWGILLTATNMFSIFWNLRYFFNKKVPYATITSAMASNLIGGIFMHIMHEKNAKVFMGRAITTGAAISQYILGLLTFGTAVWGIVNFNTDLYTVNAFMDEWLMFISHVVLYFVALSAARVFDIFYRDTRLRYITFLKKQNSKIEYKTKALNLMKAYDRTGNADIFLEKNIDLLEAALGVTRTNYEDDEKI